MNERDATHVAKPWGYERHWAKTDRYVGKVIHIEAGHALSLQYHNRKDETILLWSGRLLFEIRKGDEVRSWEMEPGERVHVPPGTVHRMTAIEDCDGHRGVDAGTRRRGPNRRSLRPGAGRVAQPAQQTSRLERLRVPVQKNTHYNPLGISHLARISHQRSSRGRRGAVVTGRTD